MIDDSELLRLIYRFSGETVDIEEMLQRGKDAPPPTFHTPPPTSPPSGGGKKGGGKDDGPTASDIRKQVDPETGEPKPTSSGI